MIKDFLNIKKEEERVESEARNSLYFKERNSKLNRLKIQYRWLKISLEDLKEVNLTVEEKSIDWDKPEFKFLVYKEARLIAMIKGYFYYSPPGYNVDCDYRPYIEYIVYGKYYNHTDSFYVINIDLNESDFTNRFYNSLYEVLK